VIVDLKWLQDMSLPSLLQGWGTIGSLESGAGWSAFDMPGISSKKRDANNMI
jgi:hypothetical protein